MPLVGSELFAPSEFLWPKDVHELKGDDISLFKLSTVHITKASSRNPIADVRVKLLNG